MQDSKPTILVVEDDVQFRRYLAEVLEDGGFAVSLAAGGKEALEQLAQHRFEVVLTDLVMPDQDGVSLIRLLRQRWPQQRIIAMSGRGRTDIGTDSLAVMRLLGADQTLQKPFSAGQLHATLNDLLARH